MNAETEGHLLADARKDGQLITRDWRKLHKVLGGVHVHEVRHVPRDHGVLTEIFRPEWDPSGMPVVQIYQSRLFPGAIGAWSCHARTIDRLFVSQGHLKIVLYDGRRDSATHRDIMELHSGEARPALVVLPPGVWHGLQNLGAADAVVVNCPTVAYNYEDPDHYRLPYDSTEIPYRWRVAAGARLRSDAPR
jgi:dTDP-4-dehydrorhamnose 3,5-epimerase